MQVSTTEFDNRGRTGGIMFEEQSRASVVSMWGEIDVSLRGESSAAIANAIERAKAVVIDTSRVTFMDSTGVAFLMQMYTYGTREGLTVTLPDPPPVVRSVIEMLGVDVLFAQQAQPAAARDA
ncbi:MAG TPA: STAS domain-containing protein [Promicromonospora sp.]|nr:STAS domain-containing protein [Promicromonospora sp.]